MVESVLQALIALLAHGPRSPAPRAPTCKAKGKHPLTTASSVMQAPFAQEAHCRLPPETARQGSSARGVHRTGSSSRRLPGRSHLRAPARLSFALWGASIPFASRLSVHLARRASSVQAKGSQRESFAQLARTAQPGTSPTSCVPQGATLQNGVQSLSWNACCATKARSVGQTDCLRPQVSVTLDTTVLRVKFCATHLAWNALLGCTVQLAQWWALLAPLGVTSHQLWQGRLQTVCCAHRASPVPRAASPRCPARRGTSAQEAPKHPRLTMSSLHKVVSALQAAFATAL